MRARLDRTRASDMESYADISTLATMTNLRLLIPPQNGNDCYSINRDLLNRLLEKLVSTIYVDEEWYRVKYPDVFYHVNNQIIKSYKDHYVKFGYFEHRMPYPIEVVEEWYLSEYPDVSAAVHRDAFSSGQAHFELLGFKEGRLPYANFSLLRA